MAKPPIARRPKGVFLDGCRAGEIVDGDKFVALLGLVCEQHSGRNVFYHIDVVRWYAIAHCCPRRIVVPKQIFADSGLDIVDDLPHFVLGVYL